MQVQGLQIYSSHDPSHVCILHEHAEVLGGIGRDSPNYDVIHDILRPDAVFVPATRPHASAMLATCAKQSLHYPELVQFELVNICW